MRKEDGWAVPDKESTDKRFAYVAAAVFFMFIAAIVGVIAFSGMSRGDAGGKGYVGSRECAVELTPNADIFPVEEPGTGTVLLVVESGGSTSAHLATIQLKDAGGAPVKMSDYSGELSIVASEDIGYRSKLFTVRDSQTGTLYAVGVAGGSNDTSASIAPLYE